MRQKKFSKLSLVFLSIISSFILTSCGSSRPVRSEPRSRPAGQRIGAYFIPAPVLRVGLVDAKAGVLTVRSTAGLVLMDATRGTQLRTDDRLLQVSFFAEGSTGEGPKTTFRVQIASLSSEQAAQRLARKIRETLDLPAATPYNSQTRTWRVQVGRAATRGEAAEIEKRLRQAGYKEMFVTSVRESGSTQSGEVVAVSAGGNHLGESRMIRVAPARADAYLRLGDDAYRGAIEVRVTDEGTLLPINIVNLEDYLRGVLPAEMSSSVYPQLEALKAQALAARTYAVRNRGQYSDEGFDLCNTAACQVYKGIDIEQEMTDEAIEATRGEIISYANEPINALFTSTCGGHTEDVENIFQGDAAPYLRGVPCEPEMKSFARLDAAEEPGLTYGSDGFPVDFEITLLTMAHILPAASKEAINEPVSGVLLGRAISALANAVGAKGAGTGATALAVPTVADAVDLVVSKLGWEQRIDRHVSNLDVQTIFGDDSFANIRPESARNVLYFLRHRFITPEPDGSVPTNSSIDRTQLIRMLSAIYARESIGHIYEGMLVQRDGNSISIQANRQMSTYRLAPNVRLFKGFEQYTVPMSTVSMLPGDRVKLVISNGNVGALVHYPPVEGVSSDRFSRYFQWDVKYTPEQLRERIRRYADVGEITDLKPVSYGVSERIVELEVIGTEGRTTLTGLRIRWGLGLRENLFIIDRVYDEYGRLSHWRFIGRGWGHGVGLCQVGAYGMAIEGKSYREIITHYYSDVDITQMDR